MASTTEALMTAEDSPTDRWTNILEKTAEYLAAGVSVVCVLDPDAKTVSLFFPDRPVRQLSGDEDLTFPGFHVPVRRFFQ